MVSFEMMAFVSDGYYAKNSVRHDLCCNFFDWISRSGYAVGSFRYPAHIDYRYEYYRFDEDTGKLDRGVFAVYFYLA